MRGKFKKTVSLILAMIMGLSLFAMPVFAKTESKSTDTDSADFQYLSDMEWDSLVDFETGLQVDKSYYQGEMPEGQVRPLNIFGTEYEKGLGMHSNITVTYRLNGQCNRLTAVVGPDNSCNTSADMGRMGVKIYLDNKEVFYKVMDIRDPSTKYDVDLDLTGVQELKIEGTPEGTTWSDSFCFADAKVYGKFPISPEGTSGFTSFDIQLPEDSPLQGIGILDGRTIYVTVPEDADRTNLTAVFTTTTGEDIVKVNGEEQISGETVNDFSEPVAYSVIDSNGGIQNYTVNVGTWQDIPGHFYDGDAKGVPERPYVNDYTETLTMKLFLAKPDGNGGSEVRLTFDEALDLMKEVNEVTRGIPKIFYLVGWQYEGHDDKYPSWAEVNENLKCRNCSHETAKECLQWLMDEALKYNTKVSFHINSTDAYEDSPLWQEYRENDLISTSGGNPMQIGTYYGEAAYQINYTNEWNSGYYKKRVDQLLEDFPQIRRAGTIHSDAFFCRASDQSTLAEEQEARRKMIRYWRDCGVDLTSEFLYSSNGSSESNSNGTGTGLIGLIPMTWHFNQADSYYMIRPAALATGGSINPGVAYGNEQKQMELLFGRSMWGETLLTADGIVGPMPDWEQNFINEFCTSTLMWAYLNQFERQEFTGTGDSRQVTYSDGVQTSLADWTVKKDGKLVREGDDVFVPAVWKDKEIIAYSKDGYTDKEWQLPDEWTGIEAVDVFKVAKTGLTLLEEGKDCADGSVTLSLDKGEMLVLAPAGSIEVTAPAQFDLLTPEKEAVNVEPGSGSFTWENSKNSVSYQVIVAEDKEMSLNRQEKEVSNTSVSFTEFELQPNKVYYWTVTAKAETGEMTEANDTPQKFTTVIEGEPERVTNLDVMRYADDNVAINWETSEIPYTYQVLRRIAGEEEFEIVGTTTEGHFTDTTAARKAGQVYQYKIRCIAGNNTYTDSLIEELDYETYISDLEWSEVHHASEGSYWGEVTKDANLDENKGPIRMGGITFEKGISTHADSDVTYDLNGAYQTFSAVIGTDDTNIERSKPTSIRIQIIGDGQTLYESSNITIAFVPEEIELDVQGIDKLTLKVCSYDTSTDSDWGVFGAARLAPKTEINSDALRELIDKAKTLEKEDYTDSTWNKLEKELAYAEEMLQNPEITQVNIDEEVKALQLAIDQLELRALYEAKAVDDMIRAIGEVTLDSEGAIKAAREAYESLSEEAKKLVTELDTLKAAEARLAELKAEGENPGQGENPDEGNKPGDGNKPDNGNETGDESGSGIQTPHTGDMTPLMLPLVGILMGLGLILGIHAGQLRKK